MADPGLVLKTKIEIFRTVLELDPQAPVFVELAQALIEDGRPGEAVEVCRRGVAHHPDMLAGRVALIEALMADGRLEEAREAFSSAQREAERTTEYLGRLDDLGWQLSMDKAPIPEPAQADDLPEPDDLPDLPDLDALAELEAELEAESFGPAEMDEVPAASLETGEEAGRADRPGRTEVDLASPTLADLYLSQGLPEAAAQVYQRLLAKDPTNKAIRAKLKALGEEPPPAPPAAGAKARLLDILTRWRDNVRARSAAAEV